MIKTIIKFSLAFLAGIAFFAAGHTAKAASADLSAYLPPVGNQGSQGSCACWATGYYYKTFQEGLEHGWNLSDSDHQCSPAFIYNQINHGYDSGSNFPNNFTTITNQGCATMSAMPYNDDDYWTWPNISQCENGMAFRGQDYTNIFDGDATEKMDEMKALLNSGQMFVMGIPVYTDFFSVPGPEYFYDGPAQGSSFAGGHGIAIVGYDDSKGGGKGGFKMYNSWGTYWGNAGTAWISYDFVKNYAWEGWKMTDRIGYQPQATTEIGITHTWRGDLDVDVYAKNAAGATVWQQELRRFQGGSFDNINMSFDITDGLAYLPPSPTYYWALGVRDAYSQDTGTIDSFKIKHNGQQYTATDTPVQLVDLATRYSYIWGGGQPIISENSLIKTSSSPSVYFYSNGQKHLIPNPDIFANWGFSWGNISNITSDQLNSLSSGSSLKRLAKGSGSTVYLIDQGQKKPIPNPDIFANWGFRWEDIVTVSNDYINSRPNGRWLKRIAVGASSPTVYLMDQNQKKPVPDVATFNNWAFRWDDLVVVSEEFLSFYGQGGTLRNLAQAGGPAVWLISGGSKALIPDPGTFAALNLRWEDILGVSDQFLYFYPQRPI